MNNWLKIGLPILLAVLLVVSAVSLTLAITASSRQIAAYQYSGPANAQYVTGPYCYGWRSATANQDQGGTNWGYGPGRCFGWRWN